MPSTDQFCFRVSLVDTITIIYSLARLSVCTSYAIPSSAIRSISIPGPGTAKFVAASVPLYLVINVSASLICLALSLL